MRQVAHHLRINELFNSGFLLVAGEDSNAVFAEPFVDFRLPVL
jgi:hypothetical protein